VYIQRASNHRRGRISFLVRAALVRASFPVKVG
jgi:hypothetical protein